MRKLSKWEYFLHFILCQRERKRHWVVCRAWPCVLRFCAVDHFILGGRRSWVSKYRSDCVRGKICFKEIVSNTRLDLNCSSYHVFGLWVFNYLQISSYIYPLFVYFSCLSYLFVFLFIFTSVCYSFCFITKVSCWNISNNLIIKYKNFDAFWQILQLKLNALKSSIHIPPD